MNEIEKLYKNVGIKKLLYCDICRAQEHSLELCAETKCEPFYPPFITNKQIELIKWLSSKYGLYIVDRYSIGFEECVGDFCIKEDFEEALAGSINSLWQSLTEEEKQQISEILE